MKNPSDWDEEYILNNLILSESDKIELKGRREIDLTIQGIDNINSVGLAKALSAMANSGGGVLILGINDKSHTVDDGGISVSIKSNGTKSWLEDTLPQLIDPPLSKINVYEIKVTNNDPTISGDRAIYIIEIGDSVLAPHQSSIDHIYYGRVAGKSRPLSNRMVVDILNRRQVPNLEIHFSYAAVDENDPNLLLYEGKHVVLVIEIENKGPVYAQYVNSILFVPKYLLEPGAIRTILNGYPVQLKDSAIYVRIVRENVITENISIEGEVIARGPGRYVPILPGCKHMWTVPLADKFFDLQYLFNPSCYQRKLRLVARTNRPTFNSNPLAVTE